MKYTQVEIIEFETSNGDHPIVYGKGRSRDDLVYFQLDGTYLRHPENIYVGGTIAVTADEEIGRAEGIFHG